MQESCPCGSVRGASGNRRPYRDTLGALDLAFSPECPGSSQQLYRGGLPCHDPPLYSCVRFLILSES